MLPIGAFFIATCFASATLADGEVWVGKGPRIVFDSGEVLASATAFSKPDVNDDGGYTLFDAIPVDEDGRLVLNRFVSGEMKVDLFCRGHYAKTVWLGRKDDYPDIVLRRRGKRHQMRCFRADKVFPANVCGDVCKVDLVEGDFMPPYGYGRVADAVVCVCIDTNATNMIRHKAILEMLDERSGFGPYAAYEKDALEIPREVDDAACTNRIAEFRPMAMHNGLPFRVRGHYGYLAKLVLSYGYSYLDGGTRRFKLQEGQKAVELALVNDQAGDLAPVSRRLAPVRPNGKMSLFRFYSVRIEGRVNTEAGERGLECAPVRTSTPERHPAPEKDGGFAFGVSEDGRSAVWFGPASKDWGVPGIFPRAVYTSSPAEDLRDVETLYLPSVERVPKCAFARMPRLRTVHCRYSGQWIESEAFAECPSLNAIILGAAGETTIAGDAFSGCALDMTGVFFKNESSDKVAWRWLDCTDVWMRQVDIPMWGREFELIGMKVDLDRGKVEMPVIHFNGDGIVQEFEDGRVYEIYSDGSEGRRMAK